MIELAGMVVLEGVGGTNADTTAEETGAEGLYHDASGFPFWKMPPPDAMSRFAAIRVTL